MSFSYTQIPVVDFSNVQSLVECAFYPQALEEILGSLQPGVKPPALLLQQLMQHTLQVCIIRAIRNPRGPYKALLLLVGIIFLKKQSVVLSLSLRLF